MVLRDGAEAVMEVASYSFQAVMQVRAGGVRRIYWRCVTDLLEARRMVEREGCAVKKMVAMEVARRSGYYCANEEVRWWPATRWRDGDAMVAGEMKRCCGGCHGDGRRGEN